MTVEGERARSHGRNGASARSAARTTAGTAVVLATTPADEGGAAAALPWDGGTVLGRLLRQLATLGVRRALVVTRPDWTAEIEQAMAGAPLDADVRPSPDLAGDLRAVAGMARDADEALVLAYGDIVTQREPLAGLLSDPRLVTGILARTSGMRATMPFETRSSRGRVLAAASPYHAAGRSNGFFLGAVKVDVRDRGALVAAADALAELAEPPQPAAWAGELERKEQRWRMRLARARIRAENGGPLEGPIELDPDEVVLGDEDERELRRRMAAAETDAVSLLLVGLVRSGVHVSNSHLRGFFWARPLSREAAEEGEREIQEYDEERLLLDSAVKANDGFFTTFFVSPYSRYIARWAARVGLTPNVVTTISMGLGILSAAAFATGERPGMIAGAILLQVAFTFDCVDGQLARYTRTFSKLGAWLDSVFDRGKEYVVFAGLAIGSTHGFGDDVWALAAAALTLQTTRHMLDFSFAASQHRAMATAPQLPLEQPGKYEPVDPDEASVLPTDAPADATAPAPSPLARAQPEPPTGNVLRRGAIHVARFALGTLRAVDRIRWTRWPRKMIAFPIGERFAAVSLVAAIWSPRATFTVLLVWGGIAFAYAFTGRMLRSLAR